MSRKWIAMAAVVLAALAASVPAGAARATSASYALKASLALARSVNDAAGASGRLVGKLTVNGKKSTFTWTLTFAHLSGTATHAGIYFGTTAKSSQLAMLLCNKCSSGGKSYYRGIYVATPSFVKAIVHGNTYAIILTKKNPTGEIRGQIKAGSA